MANELTITLSAAFVKGGTDFTFPDTAHRSVSVTVTGTKAIVNRQVVGTSEEPLLLGDIGVGGYLVCVNRDTANFVSLRSGTGATNFVRINAGEVCLFRVSTSASAPFAIADTASVELEYMLIAA